MRSEVQKDRLRQMRFWCTVANAKKPLQRSWNECLLSFSLLFYCVSLCVVKSQTWYNFHVLRLFPQHILRNVFIFTVRKCGNKSYKIKKLICVATAKQNVFFFLETLFLTFSADILTTSFLNALCHVLSSFACRRWAFSVHLGLGEIMLSCISCWLL